MVLVADLFDATTIVAGAVVALVVLLVRYQSRPKNFPPGPHGLPLVGYAPFLGKNAGATLMKLKEKYGAVVSVQIGRENWVVLNDYATINEAFVRQSDKFSGRPDNYLIKMITQGFGLLGADYGPTWKSLRKFGSVTLRGFGVGKKGMENKLEMAISNIISQIVFGSRFDYEDERFLTLTRATDDMFKDSRKAKAFAAIVFAPLLRYLPGIRETVKSVIEANQLTLSKLIEKKCALYAGIYGDWHSNADKCLKIDSTFISMLQWVMGVKEKILQEIVDEHRGTYVEDDIRDFIDAFLKEMREKGDDDPSFNDNNLLQYIRDLFQAGTATTASTIHWSIFTFCHFPETQNRIAEEIKDVLGKSATPEMKHRDQMPYTCAFIQEIMRLKTLAPLGLFHKTSEDSILRGHFIPKNTTVTANLWAVHHDPETFTNPDSFCPARFLDDGGSFVNSKHVIPFSVGPRYCIGEQLGKMEIFLFLTTIVKKFKIVPDPSTKLPPYEDFSPTIALSYDGPEFDVIFQDRFDISA